MSDKTTLMFLLRTPELRTAWLLVSWHPVAARVHVTPSPPVRGSAAEAYPFAEVVSGRLSGLVLTGVEVPQVRENAPAHKLPPSVEQHHEERGAH